MTGLVQDGSRVLFSRQYEGQQRIASCVFEYSRVRLRRRKSKKSARLRKLAHPPTASRSVEMNLNISSTSSVFLRWSRPCVNIIGDCIRCANVQLFRDYLATLATPCCSLPSSSALSRTHLSTRAVMCITLQARTRPQPVDS